MNTVQEILSKLEADLQKVKQQLEILDSASIPAQANMPEWICAWPKTLLSVDTNAEGTQYIITPTLTPTRWNLAAAQFICMNVENGRHERPVMMTERTFYQMSKEHLEKTLEDFKLLARV